jgi:hypothetical protein
MISNLLDTFIKILPGLAILGGLIGAKIQLNANKRQTQITIAKNHYREMLELFLKNSDVLYRGAKDDDFSALVKDTPNYRRYRMLFTNMVFALQEIYFALDIEKDMHWKYTIANFISLFRCLIISDEAFPPSVRATLDPKFLKFIVQVASSQEHPFAKTSLASYSN